LKNNLTQTTNKENLKDSLVSKELITSALDEAVRKVDHNIEKIGSAFPWPATKNNEYETIDNIGWTTGFWTGQLWLIYEYTGDEKYRKLAEEHVDSFHHRIKNNIWVDHHDLGFLYTPSCVAAYKLTGNEKAREAALMAADKLASRYHEKGEFIQAWGDLSAKDNYRLIVDCLLNIPLLYWASDETGDQAYREIAKKHFQTTMKYAVRKDGSAYHTYYFDPETGQPVEGKTHQGYTDDSSWARGQAWVIYGIALNYAYNPDSIELFEDYKTVTDYYLNHMPEDWVPYWDFIFKKEDNQSRDSSAAAVAICGMNMMNDYLPESYKEKEDYDLASQAMLKELILNYTEQKTDGITALINHGVYNWHKDKGVDEGTAWGDYFYLEALIRFYKNWEMYW
jgi:unsaturated chondroitin disaccharide hydrolase